MDTTYSLAQNVVVTNYQNIPMEVVEVTKKEILDSLGIGLAGSGTAGIKEIVGIVREWGGKPESTILVYGGKVPAPNAAQVNASMVHALDFDDTHDLAVVHPASVAVPSALAMAERQGRVSGKELITAIALGVDLACRMALATKLRRKIIRASGGWHPTVMYGFFSAAAVAGKLLRLDEEKMLNALGIAYHQAAGNVQCVADGAMTKKMGPGFAAKGGITAALMAEKGITGARDCIEGEVSIYNLYHDGCNLDELTLQLGKSFEGANVSFKPYPCCRINHRYIDAALEVVKQYDIKPEEVDEIEVTAGTKTWNALCQPLDVKRQPRNIVDSQFSLPWTMACVVVRRKVGLKEFTEESIKDPALLKMSHKVTPVHDSSFEEKMDSPMNIKIKTKRGEFTQKTGAPYGSPANPMTMEAMTDKFRDCASVAIKSLPQIDHVIDMVTKLEELDNVSDIFQWLG